MYATVAKQTRTAKITIGATFTLLAQITHTLRALLKVNPFSHAPHKIPSDPTLHMSFDESQAGLPVPLYAAVDQHEALAAARRRSSEGAASDAPVHVSR